MIDGACAWCAPSGNGSDGICDSCVVRYFGVDPATLHQEIAAEEAAGADEEREEVRP